MDAIADEPPPQCTGLGPIELMETLTQPARELIENAQVLVFPFLCAAPAASLLLRLDVDLSDSTLILIPSPTTLEFAARARKADTGRGRRSSLQAGRCVPGRRDASIDTRISSTHWPLTCPPCHRLFPGNSLAWGVRPPK